jgi:hypothetical protein
LVSSDQKLGITQLTNLALDGTCTIGIWIGDSILVQNNNANLFPWNLNSIQRLDANIKAILCCPKQVRDGFSYSLFCIFSVPSYKAQKDPSSGVYLT